MKLSLLRRMPIKAFAKKSRTKLASLPKRTRGVLIFILVFAIAGVTYLVASHATVPSNLYAGQELLPGQYLQSASGQYIFAMQTDGNLVVYNTYTSQAIWNSGTEGTTPQGLFMQTDGNLVEYSTSGQPIWYSHTDGTGPGSHVSMQDDSNLVIYSDTGQALWGSINGIIAEPSLAPTAVSWGSGRVDVFERGADNNIYHKWFANGGWSGWENLGGTTYDAPAVSSWGAGRLDLFVRGTDNVIYHKWYQDGYGWSGWESLGGATYSAPTAVSWGSGRIDLFVRGTDNAIYQKWYQSGWSGWVGISGPNTTYDAPSVSSWAPGRLDLFVRGTDNVIYHKWYQSGWSGWESLGGATYSAPTAVSWGSGRIDLFVRGTDNAIYQKWYQSGWSGWVGISGPGTTYSAPSVSTWGVGRLDLFVRGTDNNLYHKYYSSGWSGWENLGAPTITPTPAPTVSFLANSTSLKYSADTVLSWNATNATGCTASGAWSGSKATSGSYTTNALISNSNFGLTCSGSGGSSSQAVNIQVLPSSPATTINGYSAPPGATFADIGDTSGFPNLNETPNSYPPIVACAPGYYPGYCPTGLWWEETKQNGPNGDGQLLTYVNSGNPAGLWVDDETPCNTAQPPSSTYPNGLAAEPSGNTTVNTTVNGKTVYSSACVQLWVSYIHNNLGYSLPIYAGVAVSWPVSTSYPGGTALFEWYPQSCGYSGNPPSGAHGYIVNRFFSGGAGSGCNGPAPTYSQFLNLWNAAANKLYNSNTSAVNYTNATVGWY